MHGRPGPSVRRTVRGARRGPERACAGRRARLLPRPHLAETAAQWRRPWPLHVPSPTCSLTWTASCWVGSLRPLPARAVRGSRRGGGSRPSGPGAAAGPCAGPPGQRRKRHGHARPPARGSAASTVPEALTSGGRAARGGRNAWGRRSVLGDHRADGSFPSGFGGSRASVSPSVPWAPACPEVHAPCT